MNRSSFSKDDIERQFSILFLLLLSFILRFCTVKYDDSAREMDNLFVHLTNVAIQGGQTVQIVIRQVR